MQVIHRMVYSEYRVSIYFENGVLLVVPYGLSILQKLHGGVEVPTSEYKMLENEHLIFKCKNSSYKYLSIRLRSRYELEHYLRKKGFDLAVISLVLDFLEEKGLIDDREFANKFVEYKFRSKVQGKNLLYKELYNKGISRDIATKAIENVGADIVDMDAVFDIAWKRYEKVRDKKNPFQKIAFSLSQRGFDGSVIYSTLDRVKKTVEDNYRY